jgi:hypothetical protein
MVDISGLAAVGAVTLSRVVDVVHGPNEGAAPTAGYWSVIRYDDALEIRQDGKPSDSSPGRGAAMVRDWWAPLVVAVVGCHHLGGWHEGGHGY